MKGPHPILTKIEYVGAVSQYSACVQPRTAEDYEYPAHIAHECQVLSDYFEKPVVLLGKHGDRHTFLPHKRK